MTLYRQTVWYLKGIREYTKQGYQAASKHFNDADLDVNLKDQHFMITGANSGLGKATAMEVSKKGGIVHMVCRNQTTAAEARQEIIDKTGNNDVHVHILDLSDTAAIAPFVEDFAAQNEVLHVLINNAGCMINVRELTPLDFEKNFATNTLGTHLLTTLLIPLLEKAERARVITVSSGGMLVQKLNMNDLQFEKIDPFDGTMAYAQNKRQQVIMTEQYAKKWPNIQFSSMHPGWADTPAVRSAMPDFYEKMKDKLRTAEEGADCIVWLAVSKAAMELSSGLFYQDRKAVSTHLPLAWTKSLPTEEEKFMSLLDDLCKPFKDSKSES